MQSDRFSLKIDISRTPRLMLILNIIICISSCYDVWRPKEEIKYKFRIKYFFGGGGRHFFLRASRAKFVPPSGKSLGTPLFRKLIHKTLVCLPAEPLVGESAFDEPHPRPLLPGRDPRRPQSRTHLYKFSFKKLGFWQSLKNLEFLK